jgi:uncharacterized alkaline shock family protein YloU
MTDIYPTNSKTTIALDVLLTIARLTTLRIPGVSRFYAIPGGVNRLFKRHQQHDGVIIEVHDDTVSVELYLVVKSDVNIREISRKIQFEVARAISEMVGMQVGKINIHVEDIDFPDNLQVIHNQDDLEDLQVIQ